MLSEEQPVIDRVTHHRELLVELALSQVGVHETTGNNDGPQIKKYLKVTGLSEGYAWCAAFIAWLHTKLNIPNPESAWSPDWFKTNVVFDKFDLNEQDFVGRIGQVFGLFFNNRISHVGLFVRILPNHYETVEGNTSLRGIVNMDELTDEEKQVERESIWVAHKLRNKRDIAKVSDFVGAKEILQGWKEKNFKIKTTL